MSKPYTLADLCRELGVNEKVGRAAYRREFWTAVAARSARFGSAKEFDPLDPADVARACKLLAESARLRRTPEEEEEE